MTSGAAVRGESKEGEKISKVLRLVPFLTSFLMLVSFPPLTLLTRRRRRYAVRTE